MEEKLKIDLDYLGSIQTLWERKRGTLESIIQKYSNFSGKIWSIGDLHLPFAYVPALKHLYGKLKDSKRRGIKNLIIASGDWLTFDAFSSFLHLKQTHTIGQEVERLKHALKIFKEFGDLIYLKSNHELRLEKWLARNAMGKADELAALGASLEKNLDGFDITLLDNWFVKVGDALLCHPESGSMVRGRAADWCAERFNGAVRDWSVIFVAHTHKQAIIWHKKKLAIECGALCKTQDYALNGKVASWRNEGQYYGFGEALMSRGRVDLNTCRFEHCGFEPPIL